MTSAAQRILFAVAALVLLVAAPPARAGGGPENVFVVVNAASWASITVANEFIAQRKIPAVNVLYLNWSGEEKTDGETFRREILTPALQALEARGVAGQIDYIVYSSDLPYAINLRPDYPAQMKFPQPATPLASINSATFFWHLVMSRVPNILELNANQYMRAFANAQQKVTRVTEPATHGFRSWYGWGSNGELREGGGQPYMLSTMLAYTSGRGTSVRQAREYLRASAGADGTFPAGTIYFTRTSDVRSTSRQDEVAAAMAELEKLGVSSRIVSTEMPMQASDVLGVMSGSERFSWPATGSTLLPGAICDNFTSFGGILTQRGGQTPCTEFLRYGAAGAAGTVTEPLAIAQKFASPHIFVHYARGCSLAEAYYQSLFAPTQVVIVGDPLCQPWANIPQIEVAGIEPGGKVSGTVTLEPRAKFARPGEVARYELYVDGRRALAPPSGEPLVWDSTSECDGYHELRVVAISAGPIETRGRAILPVTVDNHGQAAILATRPKDSVHWGEKLQIAAKAAGAKQIHVLNNGRLLGTIEGEQGAISVPPASLGLGSVDLQAIAITGSTRLDRIIPPPVRLAVEPAPALPALPGNARDLLPGLMLRLSNERLVPVQDTREPSWLSASGVGAEQPFVFQAYFEVPVDEVYQFQLWHYGELKLEVDGQPLYRNADGQYRQRFAPVHLAEGLHRLTVSGTTGKQVKLRILFGGPGAETLEGQQFRHPQS